MAFFAMTSPATTGPLNTMLPLGQELLRRSHRVGVIGIADMQKRVQAAGIEFFAVGERDFPLGSSDQSLQELGRLQGLPAMHYTIDRLAAWAQVMMDEAPQVLKNMGAEALVANQGSVESGTVADAAHLPFYTVSSAVPLNQEPAIPPVFTPWDYNPSLLGVFRNKLAYLLQSRAARPITSRVIQFRREKGLRPYSGTNEVFSPLLQISQFPEIYEFPRKQLPAWFHFTGPFHSPMARAPVAFPWEKLRADRPLIYASLGTLQNRLDQVFQTIIEACEALPVQLVLSSGGGSPLAANSQDTIVVPYAPQIELIKKSALMITHGGTNSVMECMAQGVPVIAIPIANDHPGNAARIRRAGVGLTISPRKLNSNSLKVAIQQILNHSSYRDGALKIQKAIQDAGGVRKAADLVEEAFKTGRPVLR